MKIGVIAAGYNCEEFLKKSLEPWVNLKKSKLHDIVISVVHSLFIPNDQFGMSVN